MKKNFVTGMFGTLFLIFEQRRQRKELELFDLESKEELHIRFIGSKRPNLKIGRGTYINGMDLYCWDNSITVAIGRYCSIADKITIIAGGEHDKNWVSTYPFIPRWNVSSMYSAQQKRYKGNIVIGNDVWIGNNVVILSGVVVSDGAIIAAGSVVTKDIPPYSTVGGNPAKIINKRFSDDIIAELLEIKWWDWDKNKIIDNLGIFSDVVAFIIKHKQT